jgi:glycine dehydrogenase subunit 1
MNYRTKEKRMAPNDSQLPTPHPFMANSAQGSYAEMMQVANVSDIEELFEQIPENHTYKQEWNFPPALKAESQLYRHLNGLLRKNISCEENLNFLGAGCWQHYVPAICDEMVTRTEFLTPVWGTPSSDHGRNQVWFEFESMLGELVGMEFVGLPVYSFGAAAGHAIRMASRLNNRNKVIVPESLDPERFAVIRTYCGFPELADFIEIITVKMDRSTGRIDLKDLQSKVGTDISAVYLENPSYLGVLESDSARISEIAHACGIEVIVGVDPISLGVISSPAEYGADIVVGTTQTLGVHMNCGGGVGGFIATRDEEKYAREYPTMQVSLTDTTVPGEMAFGLTLFEQSSYGSREHGKDWTGNSVYLWTVANATYMSLMGPSGFEKIGKLIIEMSHYAAARISEIPNVSVLWKEGFFKEFVIDFSATNLSVAEVNRKLLQKGIFGGKDLSIDFPHFGQSSLYCVTEIHTQEDIEILVAALSEVTK